MAGVCRGSKSVIYSQSTAPDTDSSRILIDNGRISKLYKQTMPLHIPISVVRAILMRSLISGVVLNPYDAEIFCCEPWKPKCFFSIWLHDKWLRVRSFRFILIPKLWVYKYFNSFIAETDFRRQNLTSVDVRFWRVKTVPALKLMG